MKMIAKPIARALTASTLAFAACLMSAASVPGGQAVAAELTFDLRIERGRLTGNTRTIQVKQGDVVKLRFATDQKLTVHLHGYDIEKRIEPGVVGEISFTARATGRFPVHLHGANQPGGHGHEERPLAYVEVYPR
jgi:hypothetical protein